MLHTSGRSSPRTIMGNCFSNSPGLNSTVFVLPKKSSLPKERKKNNFINFTHTVSFHPDFTIMKVGGSLLSLIWGGGGRGTERNILVIRRHWVKLIAALWATIGLRTVISLLYKLGNGCMQSCRLWYVYPITWVLITLTPNLRNIPLHETTFLVSMFGKCCFAVVSIKQFKEMLFCL